MRDLKKKKKEWGEKVENWEEMKLGQGLRNQAKESGRHPKVGEGPLGVSGERK